MGGGTRNPTPGEAMYPSYAQDPQFFKDAGVLIPDVGAAKYWYVDPSAKGVPGPAPQQTAINPAQLGVMDVGPSINPDVFRQVMPVYKRPTEFKTKLEPGIEAERAARAAADQNEEDYITQMEDLMNAKRDKVYKTITMDINGAEWEVPANIPNLNDNERYWLQFPHEHWPKSVLDKIEDHARDLLEQGLDPFYNPGEVPQEQAPSF